MLTNHPAVAEAEQTVRDHRDRLKAIIIMQIRLFKRDFDELQDDESPEVKAMVATSYRTQLNLYMRTWGEVPDLR